LVDGLRRNQRQVQIMALAQHIANVLSDEQASRGYRWTEQRVDRFDYFESCTRRVADLAEQLGHERRHRTTRHHANALPIETRKLRESFSNPDPQRRDSANSIL